MTRPGSLKLGFVTFEYAGVTHAVTGGIGNWIARLAPALVARGHSVLVVTNDPHNAGVLVTQDGVCVERVKTAEHSSAHRDAMRHFTWPRRVRKLLLAHPELDLVVAPEWSGAAVAYAKRRRSGPLLTQLHSSGIQIKDASGDALRGRASPALLALQTRRERGQATWSDAVAGCSAAVLADTVARWDLSSAQTFVLPNVVDVAMVRRTSAARPRHRPPGRYVLFFGRLVPLKGIDVLAVAMRHVWSQHPDVELVCAGVDPGFHGRPMIEHARELAGDTGSRIRGTGSLPAADLLPLVREASVVALPSLWEALPFAVLESMAVGAPLVVTTGHGGDDLVRNGVEALGVPRADPAALGRAIARLLNDTGLAQRLGGAAAMRSLEFDLEPGARQAEAVFREVIIGHATR